MGYIADAVLTDVAGPVDGSALCQGQVGVTVERFIVHGDGKVVYYLLHVEVVSCHADLFLKLDHHC